jgi:hypothetical protein
MRLNILRVTAALLFCGVIGGARANNAPPFDYLKVGVDAGGFITLQEGVTPAERFFPLGVFFYPAPPGETERGGGGGGPEEDYQKFASMGGNLVVAPWVPERWPNRPGAIFLDESSCRAHMAAAGHYNVKIIADPALFWGKAGVWGDDGALVSDVERQTWFNEASTWIVASLHADEFMGYYNWDEPAWRYYDSRNRPPAKPTPAYIAAASANVNALETAVNADHAVYMAQRESMKVRDLWEDYHAAADIVGGRVLPFPAPQTLQARNEIPESPEFNCLLPNYNASASGSIEDAIYEAARYPIPGAPRNKPYVAVLQAKKQGGVNITYNNLRFQAYDAIIHGAKGLVWYDDNDGLPLGQYDYFYKDVLGNLRTLMTELWAPEVMGALKGDYGNPLIAVTTYPIINGIPSSEPCEESTLVGGKMVPRSHFLSDRIIIESVAKKYDNWTYLFVACRAPASAGASFRVRFRPYFSAYDYNLPWGYDDPGHKVCKLNHGWMTLASGPGGGWWEDDFTPEGAAIYKLQTPDPWQPPIPP